MESIKKQKNNWVAVIFIFIFMILAAITENTKGIFVPSFKSAFNISDTTISYLFIAASATYTLASYFGGVLCEKIGQKKVFIIGVIEIIIALLILSRCESFTVLVIGTGLASMGISLGAISCNTVLPIIVISAQVILMNVMHFCYGLGSSLGQWSFGRLNSYGISWRHIYFVTSIVFIIFLICFIIFVDIPHSRSEIIESKLGIKKILKNKLVIFYIFSLGFYVFAEVGTANWFVFYMQQSYNKGIECSTIYLPLFFIIFSIGRLFGGIVVQKRGYFNVLIKSVLFGSIIYIVGISLGIKGVFLISLSGLFYSITFPTVVLSISKVFIKETSYITGVIVSLSTCLTMVFNFAVGLLSDSIGIGKAFYLIPVSGVFSALLMIYIYNATKEVLINNKK